MSEFENNIVLIYGADGKLWLKELPNLQAKLTYKFGVSDLTPYSELTYNYVAFGLKDNLPVVLKIGFDIKAIEQEYNALSIFHGNAMVSIVDQDLEKGAILLSRAIPGQTLISLFPNQDKMALEIACKLVTKIHQASIPTNHKFPLLSEWLSIIDQNWDFPMEYLKIARTLKNELLNNSKHNVLLHGDVHYGNILSAGNEWLMIDPKGVIGDPLYDMTGCLLREPFNEAMETGYADQLLQQRMEFAAKYAKVDIKVIWNWTYVQTVMSICWSLEDGYNDIGRKLEFLDMMALLLQKYNR